MDLIAALLDLCKSQSQPIIAIDGPAGAGKTTMAHTIALALSSEFSVTEIHMDDLYDGWDAALSKGLTTQLLEIAQSHKQGSEIFLTTYDWESAKFNPPRKLESSELLILEGVGSGQRAIRELLNVLIWIDIEDLEGMTRVLQRDGNQIEHQMKKWLITQEQHFASEGTEKAADFILTT